MYIHLRDQRLPRRCLGIRQLPGERRLFRPVTLRPHTLHPTPIPHTHAHTPYILRPHPLHPADTPYTHARTPVSSRRRANMAQVPRVGLGSLGVCLGSLGGGLGSLGGVSMVPRGVSRVSRGVSRVRANMAQRRRSRPDSGLGFRKRILTAFWGVPSSLSRDTSGTSGLRAGGLPALMPDNFSSSAALAAAACLWSWG